VPVYEDEHAAEDLQLPEVRMALGRGRPHDSQRRRQTHRKNVGAELSSSIIFYSL